MDLDILDLADV